MAKEVHKIPAGNAAPQRPVPAFGVRISRENPTFEFGEGIFRTKLLSVTEDLELSRYQEALEAINTRKEAAGTPKNAVGEYDFSVADMEEMMNAAAPLVANLLQRRLIPDGNALTADQIDAQWVKDNMVSTELARFLSFLRTGQYFDVESLNLMLQPEGVDTPNAAG